MSDTDQAPTPNPIEAPSSSALQDIINALKYILLFHPDDPGAQEHAAKLAKHQNPEVNTAQGEDENERHRKPGDEDDEDDI